MLLPISELSPSPLPEGISREYLLWHHLCPVSVGSDGRLVVAVAPGFIPESLDEVARFYGMAVVQLETSQAELESLIERVTSRTGALLELAGEENDEGESTADVRDLANQPPVIRYVNLLVREAYELRASDVHLEASREGLIARYRLDGVLTPAPEPPRSLQQAVVSRIKILAELDIAEKRRPQDGRIRVRLESRELDLRVSTIPTIHGESVVLRLLDRGGRPVALEELGMSDDVLTAVSTLARRPHGMLLVTGPTGSGKTTTLYAALQARDATREKIITIEDPIEYELAMVTQVPVHRQAGLTFANALRAILRQDPDVIMIGEMRDRETADIAVQASMTGHFVFTTLHTNDAVSAIPRLLDLEVPGYLVAATVEGILAQRLVRRICSNCRVSYSPSADYIATVSGRPSVTRSLTRGAGCVQCRGSGFRGRLGIFELFQLNDETRQAITAGASRQRLRDLAAHSGMVSLRLDGWRKIELGLTTVEEVLRVTQD
jgi:general secretion pathway protein E